MINKQILNKIAKEVFEEMFISGDCGKYYREKRIKQISNTDEIEGIVDKIISSNEDQKTVSKW